MPNVILDVPFSTLFDFDPIRIIGDKKPYKVVGGLYNNSYDGLMKEARTAEEGCLYWRERGTKRTLYVRGDSYIKMVNDKLDTHEILNRNTNRFMPSAMCWTGTATIDDLTMNYSVRVNAKDGVITDIGYGGEDTGWGVVFDSIRFEHKDHFPIKLMNIVESWSNGHFHRMGCGDPWTSRKEMIKLMPFQHLEIGTNQLANGGAISHMIVKGNDKFYPQRDPDDMFDNAGAEMRVLSKLSIDK